MASDSSLTVPDAVVRLALDMFFDLGPGWVDVTPERESRSYRKALELLVDSGLLDGRNYIDAERNREWLRIHGWRCWPMNEAEYLFCLRNVLKHAGWTIDGKVKGNIAFHHGHFHSVRHSEYGEMAREGVHGPFKKFHRDAMMAALCCPETRVRGKFTVERHDYLPHGPGVVAIAQAAASANVGDINNNVVINNDLSGIERVLAELASKLPAAAPSSTVSAESHAGAGPQPRKEKAPKGPTTLERETYYVYSAVEDYLLRTRNVSKVKQRDVHRAAKRLLGDEIDREEIKVSEGYEVQPDFEAFVGAYRRGRKLLSEH